MLRSVTPAHLRPSPGLPLLGLLGLVVLFYVPQLMQGTVQYDGVDVHYASQQYLAAELHAGRLPTWTPYLFTGFPFLADLQVGAWYPLNWPFFAVGIGPRSMTGELLVHTAVAAAGTYWLAWGLVGQRAAAVVAALAYSLGGFFMAHSQHVGMFQTAAWLPWLVLLLEAVEVRLSVFHLVAAALLGAALALPGAFQIALYAVTGAALWAIADALVRRAWPALRHRLAVLAAVGLGGAWLSAPMILPAAELVGLSIRAQLRAQDVPVGYFVPEALLTLVQPDHYGLLSGRYVGPGDVTQHYLYAGLLVVPLALLGLRRRRVAGLALALSLPFLWYASGPAAWLFRVVARLPGFHNVELPMHGWFLPALGLALLAGAGLADLPRRRWNTVLGGAVVGLLFVDLWLVNQMWLPLAYARTPFDTLYGAPLRGFDATATAAGAERVDGPELSAVGYRNHALQSRLVTTYGYNPLELTAYAEYRAAAAEQPRLVAGLAADHQRRPGGTLVPVADALPVAVLAQTLVPVADAAASRAALADLDPTRETLVPADLPASIRGSPDGTAELLTQQADALQVRVATPAPALLRLAVPAYPGWTATANGAPLRTVRVDHAFLGVEVPAGETLVDLRYTPRALWAGLALGALGWVAVVGILVRGGIKVARRSL